MQIERCSIFICLFAGRVCRRAYNESLLSTHPFFHFFFVCICLPVSFDMAYICAW